jgi:hypothetical protein
MLLLHVCSIVDSGEMCVNQSSEIYRMGQIKIIPTLFRTCFGTMPYTQRCRCHVVILLFENNHK